MSLFATDDSGSVWSKAATLFNISRYGDIYDRWNPYSLSDMWVTDTAPHILSLATLSHTRML